MSAVVTVGETTALPDAPTLHPANACGGAVCAVRGDGEGLPTCRELAGRADGEVVR